nr:IS3 family transposase [Massilia forsythiae]
MFKYLDEFKHKVVLEYFSGTMGFRRLSAHHEVNIGSVKRWVAAYRLHGMEGISRKVTRYDAQFKLSALQYMWDNGLSMKQTAAIFNVRNPTSIGIWESRYSSGGLEALAKPHNHARQMKAPTKKPAAKPDAERTLDEVLKENEYLRMEVEVLKKLQALAQAQKQPAPQKAQVMHELRQKYPIVTLLKIVNLPKSNFYYWDKARQRPDRHEGIKQLIKMTFDAHKGRYGYRRVASALVQAGKKIHANTVQRLMQAEGLKSSQRVKRYKSYKGQVGIVAPNVLKREFTAGEPNQKWVTDVTEFKVGQDKLYFSPIKDLFNGEIVAYSFDTRPVFTLVTSMLTKAQQKLGINEKPMLHSDQGWHYQMTQYRKMLSDAGMEQSMSNKGNCYDNASMESFFGILKSECFHNHKFASIDDLKKTIVDYVQYYNQDRIRIGLGGMSPVQYRLAHAKTA